MDFLEFDKVQREMFEKCRGMSATKGKEYANSEDRFANFNRLSERLHLDRKVVWLVYFAKHMDSIESFIHHNRTFSEEDIHGRIVDAITYLSLLDGMIQEESKPSGSVSVEELLGVQAQPVSRSLPASLLPPF